MQNNKVLAATFYRRPSYTKQVLDSIAALHGIEDYIFIYSQDWNDDYAEDCAEVRRMLAEFNPGGVIIDEGINNPRLGVDLHKLKLLPAAFEYSDYVIFVEDDTPLAPDSLQFFERVFDLYGHHPNFVSATGYNRYTEASTHAFVLANERYALDKGGQFTPWSWAMTRQRYDQIYGNDGEAYKQKWGAEANGRFDFNVSDFMASLPGAFTVYPVLPRANHIGGEHAEHTQSPEWLEANEYSPFTAASQECPEAPYDAWWAKF